MRRLILPLVFGILGTAILVSLGNWQVRRLAEKEAYLAAIDARIGAAPVALPASPDPEADRFLPVLVSGTYTGDELHVLVSVKQVGAGYRIISAFETDDGRRIMVDRGFIRTGAKDDARPDGPATVTGNLHWPDEVDSFTPDNDLEENIWFARDVPAMAAALNTEPTLVILRETSQTDPPVTPLPVTTEGIPNDHLQYIVTWYGLAIVWVAMTLYYLRRQRKDKKASDR
ncbi:SURF1 family protein [Shimia biformata]|uniref:SURF1 family protein n=1 Tax=Shimia biformata TaxID=1294299 RepID=UPI00194F4035|nr:SURF1 family protein [Shimia biformata]